MGWTVNLLEGLAAHIAGNGIAAWDPEGVYDPDSAEAVITMRALPDRPDRALALALYGDTDTDDVGLADVTPAVQIRTRGTTDPRVVDDLADAVWQLLHGATMLTLGSGITAVHTTLIHRRSGALLGPDASGRHERTDNYYIDAARPNAHRPD